jgi:hypothetical protein
MSSAMLESSNVECEQQAERLRLAIEAIPALIRRDGGSRTDDENIAHHRADMARNVASAVDLESLSDDELSRLLLLRGASAVAGARNALCGHIERDRAEREARCRASSKREVRRG